MRADKRTEKNLIYLQYRRIVTTIPSEGLRGTALLCLGAAFF